MSLYESQRQFVDQQFEQIANRSFLPDAAISCGQSTNADNGADDMKNNWGTAWIWCDQFTGLEAGCEVTAAGIKLETADGNFRMAIYDDNAGVPNNLLTESGDVALSGTDPTTQLITFATPATIPADGIIWVGFQHDSATARLYWTGAGGVRELHTYGAFSDPFVLGGTTIAWYNEITFTFT